MKELAKDVLEVKDDLVVGIEYVLQVDGQDYEQTETNDPLYFIQGHKQIIPGLESQLYGMKTGQSKQVEVSPDQAYGDFDEEAMQQVAGIERLREKLPACLT